MKATIMLPVHGGAENAMVVFGRIEDLILSSVRDDHARIVADFRDARPVMFVEITTNDFNGLMGDLDEEGFL